MISRLSRSQSLSSPRFHSFSRIMLLSFAGVAVLMGCDEPPANNPPTVIGEEVEALCERKEGALALSEVNFVIEDLQGSDTLIMPYVEYRNVSIPVEANPLPAPTPEELVAAKASGEELNACGSESCRMMYSWVYDRNDEAGGLMSCTEEGYPVIVIIKDINNNEKSFQIIVKRDE